MLLSPVSQKQAAAGGDFKGTCRVLIGAGLPQKSYTYLRTRERPRVIVLVNLPALVGTSQELILMT